MGTIFTLLVNNYMILITSHQEDINQTSKTHTSTLQQALALLNAPQDKILEKTKELLICQQKMSHKPQLLTFLQSTLLTVATITSRKEDQIQDLKILDWVIEFVSSDLTNRN